MGCDYEGANRRLISISVPPLVSLDAVSSRLTDANLHWEYANPAFEQSSPTSHEASPLARWLAEAWPFTAIRYGV